MYSVLEDDHPCTLSSDHSSVSRQSLCSLNDVVDANYPCQTVLCQCAIFFQNVDYLREQLLDDDICMWRRDDVDNESGEGVKSE